MSIVWMPPRTKIRVPASTSKMGISILHHQGQHVGVTHHESVDATANHGEDYHAHQSATCDNPVTNFYQTPATRRQNRRYTMPIMSSQKALMNTSQAIALPAGTSANENTGTLNEAYLRILATCAPGRGKNFLPVR